MREKEYSEWMSKQGFDLLRHANCCKIAFNGGWESRQTEVDELQEEFAEDERFLKEQIKDKDLKISNLEYLQGMDKDLIQTLQDRSAALQDKVNWLQKRVDAAQKLIQQWRDFETYSDDCANELEQALKGGEP